MSCSPTTKNVALAPAESSASRTAGVASGSGPSSNVSAACAPSRRSTPGKRRQLSSISTSWRKLGTTHDAGDAKTKPGKEAGSKTYASKSRPDDAAWRRFAASTGACVAGLEEALAQLALLLRRRIELARVRERVEAAQPEQALEEVGSAVEDRAELGAPRLLDQPALEQRRDRRLRRHAADARDLGARHRLEVGDDREALGLGLGERRCARAAEQAPGGAL